MQQACHALRTEKYVREVRRVATRNALTKRATGRCGTERGQARERAAGQRGGGAVDAITAAGATGSSVSLPTDLPSRPIPSR